ncbi:MAG: transcriptional repressor LexA [Wenzhouxiangellaceae bacterium]|nr:transcriptional repressor LexA [Wenzhouxiangellaceae bacterium]MBS3747174.1 transcriptional repressor LexA [Wenzhouxiangellaceae bacterium]MBS3823582.1 transcriptional repressor LexA [Wenzhouxiangellaceae bacterium]
MKLSSRQREILAFIQDRVEQDGLPPTRAEINRHFGFSSPNAAQSHLHALERKGAVRINPRLARGIVPLVSGRGTSIEKGIPLIGRVAAGRPLLAVENRERMVDLDRLLFQPRPDYLLRVTGDSMIDAGILDGDLLAVHSSAEARSGQIVVARIEDEVTVKRLRRKGNRIVLEAANPKYQDIPVTSRDDFALEGLAVGVLRDL